MIKPATKKKFIAMRAEGRTYSEITKTLGISRDACCKLNRELSSKISEAQRADLEELVESFGMAKAARIEKLGKLLGKISAAIDQADFSKVPADRLLDMFLKYTDAMRGECLPARERIEGAETENILQAYTDLLNAVRDGSVTGEQAARESAVLGNMLKAVDVMKVQTKLTEIERMLSSEEMPR